MAVNGASHNIPGLKTAPPTAPPPTLDPSAQSAILSSSTHDSIGQQAPGRDQPGKSAPGRDEQGKGAETGKLLNTEPGTECHVKWKGEDG